jgi:hypothetical protein
MTEAPEHRACQQQVRKIRRGRDISCRALEFLQSTESGDLADTARQSENPNPNPNPNPEPRNPEPRNPEPRNPEPRNPEPRNPGTPEPFFR